MRLPANRLPPKRPAEVLGLPGAAQVDEPTLVRRACEGDRSAEEALYHRHVSYIFGMVARLLGDADEAQDVVQETFAIGLDRLNTLRDPEALRGWLAQIAVRLVRRRVRRLKLLAALGLADPVDQVHLEGFATQDADAQTRLEFAALGSALARLVTDERVAWMLRHIEEEPLEEVARICGCSLATAKRRIRAATKHLHEQVGGGEEDS